MRMTSLAAAVATIVVSTVAAADPQACITQSEQAQQARTHGRRIAARELYHACSLAECPTAIRSRRSTGGRSRSIPGGTACTSSARAARVDDQEIVAHEAEKNRVITFEAAPLGTAASRERRRDVRHHRAGPWIVTGLGVAFVAAGGAPRGREPRRALLISLTAPRERVANRRGGASCRAEAA